MNSKNSTLSGGQQCPSGNFRGWGKLFIWLGLLWAFIFVLAPLLLNNIPALKQLANYIEASGIDAGAIYYTEVEEVGDADLGIRNTFRFYLDKDEQ